MPSIWARRYSISSNLNVLVLPLMNVLKSLWAEIVNAMLPSPSNSFDTVFDKPWINEMTVITEATPIIMPSEVRKLRRRCALIDAKAERRLSRKRYMLSSPVQYVYRSPHAHLEGVRCDGTVRQSRAHG